MSQTTKGWLTQKQAAAALEVSTKTIERWAARNRIGSGFREQPGTPDVRVYDPVDIEQLRRERAAALGVTPRKEQEGKPLTPRALPPDGGPGAPLPARISQDAVLAAIASRLLPPAEEEQWLTVAEFARRSGLPRSWVMDLIEQGLLPALAKGDGRRIHRIHVSNLKVDFGSKTKAMRASS